MALSLANSTLFTANDLQAFSPFSFVPRELHELFFSFLPLVDLARSAQVSRAWRVISDSNHLWERFFSEMGLRPAPKCNPRVDYGRAQIAFYNNYSKIKDFPRSFQFVLRYGELLFLQYPEGIQAFNFRTQETTVVSSHPNPMKLPTKMEIFSDVLLEANFNRSTMVCNLFSANSLQHLFSWKQPYNSIFFSDRQASLTALFHVSENKIAHVVDQNDSGEPAILIRSKKHGNEVVAEFPHPFPIVFFQIEKDKRMVSIDTQSTLRIWDIDSGVQLRESPLQLPVSFTLEGGNPRIVNDNEICLLDRYRLSIEDFTLESIFAAPSGKYYFTFRCVTQTFVAVFNDRGLLEDFFDGQVAFISQDRQFELIRSKECVAGDIAPLNCESMASYGRLWFVADYEDPHTIHLYDLKESDILEDEVVTFFPCGNSVFYLNQDGLIHERDIYSAEITRTYGPENSPYEGNHFIELRETQLEPVLADGIQPEMSLYDDSPTYIFYNLRLIRADNKTIEIWDLAAQTHTSFYRIFSFQVIELIAKGNLLFEVIKDLNNTKKILVWNLSNGRVEVISEISDYSILSHVIVIWDQKGAMSLWSLKGQHLRAVPEPLHRPFSNYFYIFGNDYVSYMGSEGNNLIKAKPEFSLLLEFPDLLQSEQLLSTDSNKQEELATDPPPSKKRKIEEDASPHFGP